MRNTSLLSLNDLPPEGRRVTVDDGELWTKNLREFQMDCRITSPLRAELHILPLEDGWLVRGELTGEVVVPCNRCAEDVSVAIDSRFEEFEELPEGEADSEQPDDDHIVLDNGIPLLDMAALCWEEFVLALPMNPLCREDCKGLCPQCGANLNQGSCGCTRDEGDPRLAVLRGLTLKK